jgi:hypothetical protein
MVQSEEDRQQKINEFLAESKPSDALSHVLAYAYLRAKYQVTQAEYNKLTGLNERTLRSYITKHREQYEAELAKHKPELTIDEDSLQTTLSEEQLDAFINNIIKRALSPNSSVREWEFLVNFTGLQAEDVLNLGQIKSKSLRWFIKGNLSKISKYMDTKQLGVMLQESPYTYNGDKESIGNTERFITASLEDESFKLELMYFGLLFLSLYNQKAHPDLELVATAVRLNRLEKGLQQPVNMTEVKKFAKGKDIEEQSNQSKLRKNIGELIKELEAVTGFTANTVLSDEYKQARENVSKALKAPDIPDFEEVEKKTSKYYWELLVLTSAEEELRAMLEGCPVEYLFNTKNKQKGEMQQ